jgi:alkyl sulfatase BDS1-like metallo-beta-lactamase superfamily hydrolase
MICYGHHAPVIGKQLIRNELDALYDAIHYVHDSTVKGMNDGKDVYALMKEITLPPEMEVGQDYGKVSWSVRAIWESYAGWFHHRSTTELYSTPQSSVAQDLVEMSGGAENILDRAREKFDNGLHEEAIHLLDIVRDAGADSDDSRQLCIAVHQALLENSENFWLSSWLNNQIKLLSA